MNEFQATSSSDSFQEISGIESEMAFEEDADTVIEEEEEIDEVETKKNDDLNCCDNDTDIELISCRNRRRQDESTTRFTSKYLLKKIPHVGLLMAVTSSLFFSICSLIVRLVTSVNPLEHSTLRFVGVLLPSICLVVYKRENPLGESGSRVFLFLRGVLGSTGLIFHFYAFQNMPLADASVIIFSAPIFVTIFARIFLKEYCSPAHVVSVIITLLGVILISRPPFLFNVYNYSTPNMLGSIYALIGTICSANVYILIRKLKSLNYAVIMASFATIGITISQSVAVTISSSCIPCPWNERFYLILLGLFSFFGQVLLTKSLQLEQAGPVSICRTADIVFAFVWQVIFLGEVPNITSIVGAILVTSSVILMGLRKWVLETPLNSSLRSKLWFLT